VSNKIKDELAKMVASAPSIGKELEDKMLDEYERLEELEFPESYKARLLEVIATAVGHNAMSEGNYELAGVVASALMSSPLTGTRVTGISLQYRAAKQINKRTAEKKKAFEERGDFN